MQGLSAGLSAGTPGTPMSQPKDVQRLAQDLLTTIFRERDGVHLAPRKACLWTVQLRACPTPHRPSDTDARHLGSPSGTGPPRPGKCPVDSTWWHAVPMGPPKRNNNVLEFLRLSQVCRCSPLCLASLGHPQFGPKKRDFKSSNFSHQRTPPTSQEAAHQRIDRKWASIKKFNSILSWRNLSGTGYCT